MSLAKRILMGVGATVLVAGLLTLITPKAAHALVAALVQVTNTTSNPAITWDADESTRIPYQSRVSLTTIGSGSGPTTLTNVSFAAVPAGYRLVITNVSFDMWAESGNPVPFAFIASAFSPLNSFPSFTGVYTGSAGGHAIANQNLVRYIGPGDTPQVIVVWDAMPIPDGATDTVTVSGYLVNCSVTGCPAPVH